MNHITLPRRDRGETLAHLAMGLAAGVALTAFFGSLMQVSDRGEAIVRALQRPAEAGPETFLVRETNAPGRPARAPVTGLPGTRRGVPLPAVTAPVRSRVQG